MPSDPQHPQQFAETSAPFLPCYGTVIDSGGGEVRILVNRATVEYPGLGTLVVILPATHSDGDRDA